MLLPVFFGGGLFSVIRIGRQRVAPRDLPLEGSEGYRSSLLSTLLQHFLTLGKLIPGVVGVIPTWVGGLQTEGDMIAIPRGRNRC